MADSPSQARVTWRVIQQLYGVQRLPSGQVTQGYTITYQLSSGETGQVFVPEADYIAPKVSARIAAAAEMMAAVSALGGEVKG